MDLCELAPSYVRAIAPYQPGKPLSELERELGISDAVKLASNENPRGPSPKAIQAVKEALTDVARYPDGNGFALKAALTERYAVNAEQIVLGNGSNDVLELAARAFLSRDTSAVYSEYAFAVYPLVTQAVGARSIVVPASNYAHDLVAMRQAIQPDTRMVFIANPNNPTGTLAQSVELLAFLQKIPPQVLVVLDEAYVEYLDESVKADSISWLSEFPNLIITRTFSKAYGLAGLRIGFGVASVEIADIMNRVRQPFNVNSLAQIAAQAALEDTEFLKQSYELNWDGMEQLTKSFDRFGILYIPSFGNFISFKVDNTDQVYQKLLQEGVIVRPLASYSMPEYLRVSIGLEQENRRFLTALLRVLGG